MQIAILGLEKMGGKIAEKLMLDDHEVIAWDRTPDVLERLRTEKAEFIVNQKLVLARSISELPQFLRKPYIIWSMLPAGEATETTLQEVDTIVGGGDIVIDGGNASHRDTQRRFDAYTSKGIKFLGIGLSGGIQGFEDGYCLMVGGNQEAYDYIAPLLDSLANPGGIHSFFGTGGAGHFVKMVHNGVEAGMMQAIGEGFGVLTKSKYNFDLVSVANNWQSGSIVSSFLMDMVSDALTKDKTLATTEGIIDQTGETQWTVEQAKEENVPIDVIEKSFEFGTRSQVDKAVQTTFAAKLVQAMRYAFGDQVEKKTTS